MNALRKKIYLIFLIITIVGVIVVGCGGQPDKQTSDNSTQAGEKSNEVITLKLADSFPPGHVAYDAAVNVFIPTLEESGKIKVEYFPNDQLGKSQDMIELVRSGVADIGYITAGLVEGQVPLSSIFALPNEFQSAVEAQQVFTKLIFGPLASEYERLGLQPIGIGATDPYQIYTAKKQIKSPEDLKGMVLRSVGGTADEVLSKYGAQTVGMPPGEMYESLQRGVVDGVAYSYATAPPHHLHEVAKYATDGLQLGNPSLIYFMSKEKFDSLSPEMQQLILDAGKKWAEAVAQGYDKKAEEGKKIFADAGVTIYQLTEADKRAWAEALKPAVEIWINKMESKGVSNARDVYNEMVKIKEEIRK